MKQVDTVLFDLDDTLISWESRALPWHEYVASMLSGAVDYLGSAGQPVDDMAPLLGAFSHNLRAAWIDGRQTLRAPSFVNVLLQSLQEQAIDVSALDIDAMLGAIEWRPMPGVKPFDDAHDVLDALRERGYRIGLVTNSFQPMWMRDVELTAYELLDRLDARITSGDTGFIKPHPAIYWRILGMLDRTPDRAVFVGDNPQFDIKGAQDTGMPGIYIDRPYLDRDLGDVIPDHTVTSLTEVLNIVEGLP